jgi:hypothetical protein
VEYEKKTEDRRQKKEYPMLSWSGGSIRKNFTFLTIKIGRLAHLDSQPWSYKSPSWFLASEF